MSLRKPFRAAIEPLESRLLLAVAEPIPVARPPANTGKGFFVSDGNIYDANGYQFTIHGFSHTAWWGSAKESLAAIEQFPKSRANAVRVAFGSGFGPSQYSIQRQHIVEKLIDQGIVPIVEDHTATGHTGASFLTTVVDKWLAPGNVQWLKKYEKQVILNIANEWGPDTADWRDQYMIAIDRLRAAGINAMIMIDSAEADPGPGQSAHAIETWGQELLDHDPQHNIVFSIHMYNQWRTEDGADAVGKSKSAIGAPYDIASELAKIKAQKLPIVVGEFGWQGAVPVRYNTRRAMQIFSEMNIGWLAWGWNQMAPHTMNMLKGTAFNSADDLTQWGKRVINDPQYGLKKASRPASIFQSRVGGAIFNDVNRSGVRDKGEAPIEGAVVYLDLNKDGGLNKNEPVVTTGADGSYMFGRLPTDSYDIRVMTPGRFGAWKATNRSKAPLANVTLSGAKTVLGANIGFKRQPNTQKPIKRFNISATPITIQAEDFDNGGEGVAYHDLDAKNIGGKGRGGAGVDVQSTRDSGGGNNVAATQAGEWLAYTVHVAKTRLFDIDFRVAAAGARGRFHLELDGNNVTGRLTVPRTGGWQKWATITAKGVKLQAGDHVLQLVMDADGSSGWVGNFNYVRFTRSA